MVNSFLYAPSLAPLMSSLGGGRKRRKAKGSRSSSGRSKAKKTRRRSARSKSRSTSRKPKRAKLRKGSAAMKRHMAKLRAMRRK